MLPGLVTGTGGNGAYMACGLYMAGHLLNKRLALMCVVDNLMIPTSMLLQTAVELV